ncbi:hypothetical protein [Halorientalis pallida]|uniref:Uncharacterized protein n=1 Tax=Halorientalis pallida TaxID=2479928 RepID=A0A498KXA2_9EURY|nr:hypothetical protein [Halorientalis pallida]RXK50250.1 hypothetical protein EAF64_06720 [Halorientalis pallida]
MVDDDAADVGLGRRDYLKAAGLATLGAAGTAGCVGDDDDAPERPRKQRFGYGGVPVGAGSVVAVGAATAEQEPNDVRIDATLVAKNTAVTGTLAAGEVDWYAVGVTADEPLTVEYATADETGVSLVAIYDDGGNFLDQVYASSATPVELAETAATDGTYYVQVVDIEDGGGSYTVTINSPIASTTETPTTTTPSDSYGTQGYGEYGYGGTV